MFNSAQQSLEGSTYKQSVSPQDTAYIELHGEINSLRRDAPGSSQSAADQRRVDDQLHQLGLLSSLELVSDSNSGSGHCTEGGAGHGTRSGANHNPEKPGVAHHNENHRGEHHHDGPFHTLHSDITALNNDAPNGTIRGTKATTDLQNLNNELHNIGLPKYLNLQDTSSGSTSEPPEPPITTPNPPETPITSPTPAPPETPPVTTTPPTTQPESPNGQFTVKNGEIIGPNGKQFIPKGIAIGGNDALQDESTILKDFPGLNAIRYTATPTGEYYWNSSETPTAKSPTIAQTEQFINDMTQKGIVVEIDDMDSEPNQVITQSAMDAQKKWIGQLAADEKNNPYVWFQTPNEPNNAKNSNQTIVDEQVNYYNAVRDAGNNNLVTLEETQEGTLTPMLSDKAAYAKMTNVAFDLHAYNFTPAKVSAKIDATNAITSADGKIPVFFGEYGDTYPNGTVLSPDINGSLEAVQDAGVGGLAWSFRNMGGTSEINQLTNADGTLTPYGQEVAAYIAE